MSKAGPLAVSVAPKQRKITGAVVKEFLKEWQKGFGLLMSILVMGGLILLSSALVAVLVVGVLSMPLEALFHFTTPEGVYYTAGAIGIAVWGVAGIGRCKHILIDGFEGRY